MSWFFIQNYKKLHIEIFLHVNLFGLTLQALLLVFLSLKKQTMLATLSTQSRSPFSNVPAGIHLGSVYQFQLWEARHFWRQILGKHSPSGTVQVKHPCLVHLPDSTFLAMAECIYFSLWLKYRDYRRADILGRCFIPLPDHCSFLLSAPLMIITNCDSTLVLLSLSFKPASSLRRYLSWLYMKLEKDAVLSLTLQITFLFTLPKSFSRVFKL